jgi:hypothetical protein
VKTLWVALFLIVTTFAVKDASAKDKTRFDIKSALAMWSKQNQVVVTSSAAEQAGRDLAEEFVWRAPHEGIKGSDARRLSQLIARGRIIVSASRRRSATLRGYPGDVVVTAKEPEHWGEEDVPAAKSHREPDMADLPQQQSWSISQFLETIFGDSLDELLEMYPKLHIVVQPIPPRDYSVKINGRIYQATETSLYGVSSSVVVTVRVERLGKPPCEWSGKLPKGQVQTIACTL